MITVRCKECNKTLTSNSKVQSCGCSNMMTLSQDSITANDLSQVVIISLSNNEERSKLSKSDLEFQESRRKRKVRKLDFEVR